MNERALIARLVALGIGGGALIWAFTARVPTAEVGSGGGGPAPASVAVNLTRQPLLGHEPLPAAATPVTDIKVSGVILAPGRRAALLATGTDAQAWLREGESFRGYVLTHIGPDRVTIAGPGGAQEISVFPASAPSSAPSGTQSTVALASGR